MSKLVEKFWFALLAGSVAACSGAGDASAKRTAASTARATIKRPHVQTQDLADACALLSVAEVDSVLGKLAVPPHKNEEDGACIYSVPGAKGTAITVALQIDPTGAGTIEQADSMLTGMFARELSEGAQRSAAARKPRTDGWDYVGGVSGVGAWRIGHMAVTMSGNGEFLLPAKQLHDLAALARNRIPDLPVAAPGAEPNVAGLPPDPCALLERAAAEAVLGKLAVEPFRSSESSPLADGDGPSCTYYTPGHHAFVLTPTYSDAKMLFGMYSGASNRTRSVVGGADAADPLDGPWDQAAEGSTGSLYFLKEDRMLEIGYRTSSTDIAGAAQLARKAIGRL